MTPMKQPKAQMMYWLILTMVLPVQGMHLVSTHTLSCSPGWNNSAKAQMLRNILGIALCMPAASKTCTSEYHSSASSSKRQPGVC